MLRTRLAALGALLLLPAIGLADEGMWTFNNFPRERVRQRYGFAPGDDWLRRVRLGSARLADGCSGAFVSEGGLVMTNHHCAQRCIHDLSSAGRDLMQTGFYARSQAEELRCPRDEINQLLEISDVTERMGRATRGLDGRRFNQAERAEMARIERECQTSDALRCEVVRLYHGGVYNLYRYRRFQDVRLVFAPEFAIAFFGGDPDNFNFPRYDLDVAFLRVYEGGQPARLEQHLSLAPRGALREGELVFVSGHPGRTSRQLTLAQLHYLRDVALPEKLMRLAEMRGRLIEFSRRGDEERRVAAWALFGVENSYKALKGRLLALHDAQLMAQKAQEEQALRAKVMEDPERRRRYGGAWDLVARATAELARIRTPLHLLEQGGGFGGDLFYIARALLRGAEERRRPSEERLREFRDSALPELLQHVLSPAPIHEELEILKLSFSLGKLREELGPDHPAVRKVLGRESPEELARRLVASSRLKDVALRRRLWEGGKAAVDGSSDPMLQLARLVDADARAVRKRYEDESEAVEKRGGELLAKARFEVLGTSVYPDATFTLRLSFGRVAGWDEGGRAVAPFTTIAGLYERATGRPPFRLPEPWLAARERLRPGTPMNFVTTNDIIGGNSGSPAVNRDGQIVGVVFDSNIHGLGGEYGYDERLNRAVLLHAEALVEALDKVYGARQLLEELRPPLRVGVR